MSGRTHTIIHSLAQQKNLPSNVFLMPTNGVDTKPFVFAWFLLDISFQNALIRICSSYLPSNNKLRNRISMTRFLLTNHGDRKKATLFGISPRGTLLRFMGGVRADAVVMGNSLFPPRLWAPR
ncbi:hypothetical protein CEXT_564561 [Caerostris extrusa]|uniref:Uncharacterized protein n=1 Tax=Caerostris extrusa TaxID=172846 RepID=A0AAV4RA16_CAEEX|nr:hypothetical protein CEXT_564561 [Caerostris extrusa]